MSCSRVPPLLPLRGLSATTGSALLLSQRRCGAWTRAVLNTTSPWSRTRSVSVQSKAFSAPSVTKRRTAPLSRWLGLPSLHHLRHLRGPDYGGGVATGTFQVTVLSAYARSMAFRLALGEPYRLISTNSTQPLIDAETNANKVAASTQ